jgi:hypothetical protein
MRLILLYGDALNNDLLLTLAAVVLQCLDLGREGPRELVERAAISGCPTTSV